MSIDLIVTVTTTMLTAFIGVLTSLMFRRRIEVEKLERAKLESIAQTVRFKVEEDKAQVVQFARRRPTDEVPVEEERPISPVDWKLIQELINGYHQQALHQAKVQFWFSIVAAAVGFGYILYAASLSVGSQPPDYISILPGVVIDAVALLFFRQAEQTRARATELYDRLRSDNQAMHAVTLVDSIEDVQIKSAVKAQLALHMAGLSPKEIDLTQFQTKK